MKKLIQAASLKKTSLFTFAKALGLENPYFYGKNLLLTIVRCVWMSERQMLGYHPDSTWIHRLNGTSKLVF